MAISISTLSLALLQKENTVTVKYKNTYYVISNKGNAYDHHYRVNNSYIMTTITGIKTYIHENVGRKTIEQATLTQDA